jgi:hypothetical protein
MSYLKLSATDFVVSADSITLPTWSDNAPVLESFFTPTPISPAPAFYQDVYNLDTTDPASEKQFSVAYGHKLGSGSEYFNTLVPGVSPSKTIYGQYRTLVFGDEGSDFNFGGTAPVEDIFVISIERQRYREHLLPGSLNLRLTGGTTIQLTDNSKTVTVNRFLDCGRVFDLVSGSFGAPVTTPVTSGVVAGYTSVGSYGYFLPDIATLILNPAALELPVAEGGLELVVGRTANFAADNFTTLCQAIEDGGYFQLNSQETISSNFIFARVPNQECNYTTNPSIINNTGELLYGSLINNPQTYITTVGLYNDNNELLAVAKTSKPLLKDSTKESLFRIKLDW